MSVHKLTAGDGYTYLTRQVAAHDATNRGYSGLGDYYSEKGETPGVWLGRGLAGLAEVTSASRAPVPEPGPSAPPVAPTEGFLDGPEGPRRVVGGTVVARVTELVSGRREVLFLPHVGPVAMVGAQVSERQMLSLFGQGGHPDADAIAGLLHAQGAAGGEADRAGRLGSPYRVDAGGTPFAVRSATAFRAYNTARGLPGSTAVPESDRARIRTALATEMFLEEHGRPPADARELSGQLARLSRQRTTAVAGYDLTFSPVKSVSTLWAVAPREVAAVIAQAHADAVADTVGWLEDHAAYTRRGRNGVAQVEVRGLLAAAFTHRDSRSGDPDLHTHVAVSNKVQAHDGRWLALDGRAVFRNAVAASERYNTRLEALLVQRLGVTFADRDPGNSPLDPAPDPALAPAPGVPGAGKRAVREIVGVDGPLTRAWSSRRAAIEVRRAVLSADFQRAHGRPPTAKESLALAQQANLATRADKHEPRSELAQRFSWRREAEQVLGGPDALAGYVAGALGTADPAVQARPVPAGWAQLTAPLVLATISRSRATWQQHHVRAEAERRARADGIRLADLDAAVDEVVRVALSDGHSIALDPVRDGTLGPAARELAGQLDRLEPAALRRSDGTSVYTVAGSTLFTSPAVLAAEQRVLEAAGRTDGRTLTAAQVDLALVESAANGTELNPGQAALVRALATSPARVQLALAPAGTGKTTAMRVLTRAWTTSTSATTTVGTVVGTVVGLAPSAAAAAVLREEITSPGGNTDGPTGADPALSPGSVSTDTLAKLLWHVRDGSVDAPATPGWVRGIGPGTLVVLDEAGMAGTLDLADTVDWLLARGATVRLVGDDQQLSAVSAGGVLRDLARTHGAVTLSQVLRFTHPPTSNGSGRTAGEPNHAEGAASLALRDGDPAAVAYYTDHQRVHVGDLSTVTDSAYTAWAADRSAGSDSIMIAPTRDLVAGLNARARTDRLAAALLAGQPEGPRTQLADGTAASRGDTVVTRKNERRIAITRTDWVKNGDRWTVLDVRPDGGLLVRHARTGRRVLLPGDYTAAHVALGYASTVHAAQGVTADTAHTVATGAETRQLLYVAMTRGRHANHVHLVTAGDGDPHTITTRDALLPPTAVDVLTRVLARDGAPVSAASTARALADPALRVKETVDRYYDALAVASEQVLGPRVLHDIDRAAEQYLPGLTSAPAWPTLRAHLALRCLEGIPATGSLRHAARDPGALAGALDPAAVLDYRLDSTGQHSTGQHSTHQTDRRDRAGNPARTPGTAPLPWLPPVPPAVADDDGWGRYLRRRDQQLAQAAAELRALTATWTPTTAPTWAVPLLAEPTTTAGPAAAPPAPPAGRGGWGVSLVADMAVWRAAAGVPDTDLRPTGPPLPRAAERRAQHQLDDRVARVLGQAHADSTRWQPLTDRLDPHLTDDPYWPVLARQLSAARRAGIDVTGLTSTAATGRPLPDQQPAAALWWRLSGQLSTAAVTARPTGSQDGLRPDWTAALTSTLGPQAAARVVADPAWPALVAAVTTANQHGWDPVDVLATAHDLLLDSQPDGTPLRHGELATALAWRVRLLTDTTTHTSAPASTATSADPAGNHRPAAARATGAHQADVHGTTSASGDDPALPTDDDAPDEPEDPGHTPYAGDMRDTAAALVHVMTVGMTDDGTRDQGWLAALTPPPDPYAGIHHEHTAEDPDPDDDPDIATRPTPATPAAATARGPADPSRPADPSCPADPWDVVLPSDNELEAALEALLTSHEHDTAAGGAPTGTAARTTDIPNMSAASDATDHEPVALTAGTAATDHAGLLFATRGERAAEQVTLAEVLRLNALAADYYTGHYTHGWAASYVAGRLGTDLRDDPRFTLGYAPAGWTSLVDHLRNLGATETDLLAAGLASRAGTGRLIDRFRDRLVTPIRNGQHITGFIGRRNPERTDEVLAGPKYLNTGQTIAFTKGAQMFGLTENAQALTDGATPVLVEGFLDAIAVTLAGDHRPAGQPGPRYAGIAPLGTSLTDPQTDLLLAHPTPTSSSGGPGGAGHTRGQVIVATDNDWAGQQAAHRAYWKLTAHQQAPRQLTADGPGDAGAGPVGPTAKDPAELLQHSGPDGLRAALDTAGPLATTVITDRVDAHADRLQWAEGRLIAVRAAAPVIAALPISDWPAHISLVAKRTGVAHPQVTLEVLDAAEQWHTDPRAATARQLTQPVPERRTPPPTPAQRWAGLADTLEPPRVRWRL